MASNHLQSLLYPGASPHCHKNRSISFEDLYELFVIYKSIHGNLRIPQKYLIPDGDERYPMNSWGFKLGAQLNAIYTVATWTREGHRQKLIELGILPEESQIYSHLSPKEVYQALSCYQQIYGNINDMPHDYHIPLEDSCYPPSLRGYCLGEILDCIRTRRLFFNYENLKRWRELQIEFFSELYDQSFAVMKDAFLAFKAIHCSGNGNGNGNGGSSSGYSENHSPHSSSNSTGITSPLLSIHSPTSPIQGVTVCVPHDFVVPHNDNRYPPHTWGYKLGSQSHNIRSHAAWVRGIYQMQLIEIGVLPPQISCIYSAEEIAHCLQLCIEHYEALSLTTTSNNSIVNTKTNTNTNTNESNSNKTNSSSSTGDSGDGSSNNGKAKRKSKANTITALDIPEHFVIPNNTSLFPVHMIGVPLGQLVRNIQRRELYFDTINVKKWKALGITFERKKTVVSASGKAKRSSQSPRIQSHQQQQHQQNQAPPIVQLPTTNTAAVPTNTSSMSVSPIDEHRDEAIEDIDLGMVSGGHNENEILNHDYSGMKRKRQDYDEEVRREEHVHTMGHNEHYQHQQTFNPPSSTIVVPALMEASDSHWLLPSLFGPEDVLKEVLS